MGNFNLRAFSWYTFLACSFIVTAFVVISYNTVRKFTSRRMVTSESAARKLRQRTHLKTAHAGEHVTFKAADGVTLTGLLFVRPHARRTVLVCHGYRMVKERLRLFVDKFADDNVFLFDVRGHGESEGEIITFGFHEQQDVAAAVAFLQEDERFLGKPLYAVGISMGAVALLATAVKHPDFFTAIVLDSSFADLYHQLARAFERKTHLPRVPFFGISQALFEYFGNFAVTDVSPRTWARQLQIPALVVHSQVDRLSPVSDAHELYTALASKKELWLVSGSAHGRIFKDVSREYFHKLKNFFDHYPSR